MRPSKKVILALEAVCDIAYHGGPDPVQSQDIARRLDLPRRYLEQMMQQLVREGVLKGVRGPKGGYRLARERRRITVADVVRVVRALEAGGDEDGRAHSVLGEAVMQPFWAEIEAEVMERLAGLTIEDLCARGERLAVPSEARQGADFAI